MVDWFLFGLMRHPVEWWIVFLPWMVHTTHWFFCCSVFKFSHLRKSFCSRPSVHFAGSMYIMWIMCSSCGLGVIQHVNFGDGLHPIGEPVPQLWVEILKLPKLRLPFGAKRNTLRIDLWQLGQVVNDMDGHGILSSCTCWRCFKSIGQTQHPRIHVAG